MNKLQSQPLNSYSYRFWFFPGAQRVGTHFQLNTMMDALRQCEIPFIHISGNEINANDLEKFNLKLKELEKRPERYILINYHWRTREERDVLLSSSNALYFFIWRDFRDALVSYYYYLIKRRNRVFRDFPHYYWVEGWKFLWRQSIHYQTWHEIGTHPRIFHADFSRLVTNFDEEAELMLNFAGLENINLSELKRGVSIESRRASDGDEKGSFYRKGKVGEYWELVKDKKILKHVETTLNWSKNQSPVFRQIYYKYSQLLSRSNFKNP